MKMSLVLVFAACAFALAIPASAMPIATPDALIKSDSPVIQVKGGHGGGHGRGWGRGGRGHHYGWGRGRGHR